jgi:hypothetical protein
MRASITVALAVAATLSPALAGPAPTTALRSTVGFPRRAMVATYGDAGLTPDALTSDGASANGWLRPWVVVEEREAVVRLLVEEDHARLLWWVRRDDLAWTPRTPLAVRTHGDAGIWLLPGAAVTFAATAGRGAIAYDGPDFDVAGEADTADLARTYVPRPMPRAGRWLTRSLLTAPDGDPLVTSTDPIAVDLRGTARAGWVMVEHVTAEVRVVGWVRRTDLVAEEFGSLMGTGSGIGFGMNHTARIKVPRGTCLFDDAGAVVGIQTKTSERYAHDGGDGTWSVYVGTSWGLRTARVHDLRRDRDRGQPRWRRCPR